jgi:LysR family carnitine catabolism transcriptional activator
MSAIHIKFRQIKAFTLVVELGSFKAAADRMAVAQPSLSALIKELEEDINVVLLERSTRRCDLTEAGRAFYDQVKGAVDHLEDAYRYVKDLGAGTRGRLSLASLPSLASGIVTEVLAEFRHMYPQVRITLQERRNDQVIESVRRGESELGFANMSRPEPDLSFTLLMTDRLMIVAPPAHPLVDTRPTWKSLEKYDLILMNSGPAQRALLANDVRTPLAFEVEHVATCIAMVRHGMGITLLPSTIFTTLNIDGLACIPIMGRLATRELGAITRKENRLTAPARAFLELLTVRTAATSRKKSAPLHP